MFSKPFQPWSFMSALPCELQITQTGHSTKTSSDGSIGLCILWDAYHKIIILRLWGFLCLRDAGRRGNKITEEPIS